MTAAAPDESPLPPTPHSEIPEPDPLVPSLNLSEYELPGGWPPNAAMTTERGYDDDYVDGLRGEVDRWRRMCGCLKCGGRGWLPFSVTWSFPADEVGATRLATAPPCDWCMRTGVHVSRWWPLRRRRLHRFCTRNPEFDIPKVHLQGDGP